MNINDFIACPWKSLKAGIRPCYPDCVSMSSHLGGAVLKGLFDCAAEIREVLHMTLLEIAVWFLRVAAWIVACAIRPVGYWFLGYIVYADIKRYVSKIDG